MARTKQTVRLGSYQNPNDVPKGSSFVEGWHTSRRVNLTASNDAHGAYDANGLGKEEFVDKRSQ
eukprot:6993896-Ditylum_brightwellii.AAC.1